MHTGTRSAAPHPPRPPPSPPQAQPVPRMVGVRFRSGEWQAHAAHLGATVRIGGFAAAEDAQRAFDEWRLRNPPSNASAQSPRNFLNFAEAPWAITIAPGGGKKRKREAVHELVAAVHGGGVPL